MKHKTIIFRIIKIASLIAAVLLCIFILQEFLLTHLDHNRLRIKGFYLEDSNSLDVVLIGSSEVYSGFSPGYAYGRYGYTSYPVATETNVAPNYLTCLKETMRTQNPKLVIIEINGMLYSDKFIDSQEAGRRNLIDHIPLNQNKLEYIHQIPTSPSDKLEYIFPIIKYRSVWNRFPKGIPWAKAILKNQLRGYSLLKGVKSMSAIFEPQEKIYNDQLDTITNTKKIGKKAEESLIELLNYCKSNNINVLFVRFPHIVTKRSIARYQMANYVKEIINQYGYEYLDCIKEYKNIGIELDHDFYNPEHMNVYGQVKFTSYLSKYLMDKYHLTKSKLTDKQAEEWKEAARYYHDFYQYNVYLINIGDFRELAETSDVLSNMEKYTANQ